MLFLFVFFANPSVSGKLGTLPDLMSKWIFHHLLANEPNKPAFLLGLAFVNYPFQFDALFSLCISLLMRQTDEAVFWGGLYTREKKNKTSPTMGSSYDAKIP